MKRKKTLIIIGLIALLLVVFIGWNIFGPTIHGNKYFYIKTGSTYADVKNNLSEKEVLKNTFWFNLLAKMLHYDQSVKAGRYKISPGMSTYELVKILRNGKQEPVNLVITKLRTKEDLAQKIAANFECDSLSVIEFLNTPDSLIKFHLDTNTVMTAVIPNTYSIWWNSSFTKIFSKLYVEQQKFWNDERKRKAADKNLTPEQIYIIASIVEEETNKREDKGNIASVYINRLRKDQKLEADPTVKFALKNFALRRIYNKHLAYPSPYNTYLNKGLPPGPICTPSTNTIDAVLNAPETNYMFFVARPDLKGYSNFAATYQEHLVFAKAYQKTLDSLMKTRENKDSVKIN